MSRTYAQWQNALNAHLLHRSGLTLDDIPEGGPMPFDWPNMHAEYDAGTDPVDVADHVLWCAGFPGAVPIL